MNFDILSCLIGVAGGAFFSWFFTHIYYKKSKKDSEKQLIEIKKQCEKLKKYIKDNALAFEKVDEWEE